MDRNKKRRGLDMETAGFYHKIWSKRIIACNTIKHNILVLVIIVL